MSLESGRKLGLAAAIIQVVLPIAVLVLYGVLIFSLFSSVFSLASGTTPNFSNAFLATGLVGFAFIAIGAIGIAGVVLFLVAMHRLGQYYGEPRIFNNALYSILTEIVGVVVIFAVVFGLFFALIPRTTTTTTNPGTFAIGFIALLLGVIVAALVIQILSAYFARNAFNKLGEKSGVSSFNTAGLLYLIGGVLAIVGIGSLLIWIAWIFAIMGFSNLKPKTQEPLSPAFTVPTQAASGLRKCCPYCGAENLADALFCASCGKPLANQLS